MKTISRVLMTSVLSLMLLISNVGIISADSVEIHYSKDNISESYTELDKFISIINNEFVLDLPEYITLSDDVSRDVLRTLADSNAMISDLDIAIDPETQVAKHYTMDVGGLSRAVGVSSINIYWNYINLKVSANMLRSIAGVITGILVGAAAAPLAAKIAPFWPALATTITNNGWAVQFIVGLGTDLLSGMLYQNIIKHGIEVHYNFLMFNFTTIRFQ